MRRAHWDGRTVLGRASSTGPTLELGAVALRTDTELLLKSRRVVPARLLGSGFEFEFGTWAAAARELVARKRGRRQARFDEPATAGSA